MRRGSQHGATRVSRLVLLLVLGGLVYGGVAFWPAADSYYRIWRAANLLARESVGLDSDADAALERFIASVHRDTGINLMRSSVDLDRPDPNHARVSVGLMLPYRFPFTSEQRFLQATVRAAAKGRGG